MKNAPSTATEVISLPKGGGALHGLGEKFSPDLHTGTGNFTIPIALPPGRNGFQPQLTLVYSTGNGNGPFGLGWNLSVPGVARKTSRGIPRYDNSMDVFLLSGTEDLVPVTGEQSGLTSYRPRTEGLFARIEHHKDAKNDYWKVESKDGLLSFYGTPRPDTASVDWKDFAIICDPRHRSQVFGWKLTETRDLFGNRILYEYERDSGVDGPHCWDHVYITRIKYVNYSDQEGAEKFLVSVDFEYDGEYSPAGRLQTERPDAFSEYRAGFEIRTRRRYRKILIKTHPDGVAVNVRAYELHYEQSFHSRVSLLRKIELVGFDDSGNEVRELPPLTFGYTPFTPEQRKAISVTGAGLPAESLAAPDLELVDLFGNGLPDILEMNGSVGYWRNLGEGKFDQFRPMREGPAGLALSDPGVQIVDADGNGRSDLLVTTDVLRGYYPLQFGGMWDRRSFQRYTSAPSFNLEDPEVRLVDLDGDGVADAIRSGNCLECFFNDPQQGWTGTHAVERKAIEIFPNVNFSDPHVKWADMTGDGLSDIVLVHDRRVEYWPNLGYGNWGPRVSMCSCPHLPWGYDPKRILVGDVDGDGAADFIYVEDRKVTLWINQSGNGWSDPIEIKGTPPVTSMDALRLTDLLGTGVSGVLWSTAVNGRRPIFFLDFTGGNKPCLLNVLDNHMGAVTKVCYSPSTRFYLADEKARDTRWETPLPFPVQVVAKVEVIDDLSKGKLTTEYRYHNGYWDGTEREFRGFALVEQFDSETFSTYRSPGLHGSEATFNQVSQEYFSAPTLLRTWFHQGPVTDESGNWQDLDWSDQYWSGDPQILKHTESVNAFLKNLSDRRERRDALRTLRGSILRTELYAIDGSDREKRPYTVSEYAYGLREEQEPGGAATDRLRIFFPHLTSLRTTQWERGDDPMTQFTFSGDYDEFGQVRLQTQVACPRGWRSLKDTPATPYLATRTRTEYAKPTAPEIFPADRVARTSTYEIQDSTAHKVFDFRDLNDSSPMFRLIGQNINFYDGPEYQGLPFGQVGDNGSLVRTETLVATEQVVRDAYESGDASGLTPYFVSNGSNTWPSDYPLEFQRSLPIQDNLDLTRPGLTITPVGYGVPNGPTSSAYSPGYFVAIERRRYDFQGASSQPGRGLVVSRLDPLGHVTGIAYDTFQLLPIAVIDAVGLETHAEYDYRVMQPRLVIDPNKNRTAFSFTPMGLLRSITVMGKEGEQAGDTPGVPGTVMLYNFRAHEGSLPGQPQPAEVCTLKRIEHFWDFIHELNSGRAESGKPPLTEDEADALFPDQDWSGFPKRFIVSREYSDGFGRLLQTRTQAEDVTFGDQPFGYATLPKDQADQTGTQCDVVGRMCTGPNQKVVVSGWQVYDNKGRVVGKYEPFFSEGWNYEVPISSDFGAKVSMYYDPRGQLIRTINPDGSEQRVVHGVPGTINALDPTDPAVYEPTVWEVYTYDSNDNAGRTHAAVSSIYARHWNTPNSALSDALGRTTETTERNGPDPAKDWFTTRFTYDIRGNLLAVTDPLRRVAFKRVYDLANRSLRTENVDAGVRRVIFDAAGNEIERRDSKGALILHAYDCLNRPTSLWALDNAGGMVTIRERLVYGDGSDENQPVAERDANRLNNRLGKLCQSYDEAGALTFKAYDFKGNLREKERKVIRDDVMLSPAGLPINWVDPIPDVLEQAVYVTSTSFDALNRVKAMKYPQDVDGERKELSPRYNRAGALEGVNLDGATYVERISYNAKSQRTLIAYGNGVMTRYAYDPSTFRLARMRTERYVKPSTLTYCPNGQPLQDFAYTYDLVGNVLLIKDITPGCGVTNTVSGADVLERTFNYDPAYRLITATGREDKNIPTPRPWQDEARAGFNSGMHGTPNQDNAPNLTALYKEEYAYDPAGNMLRLRHSTNASTWTRHFGMGGLTPQQWNQQWQAHLNARNEWGNPPGNKLTHVGDNDPDIPQTHTSDVNGNLIRETTSRHFDWDHSDRIKAFRIQVGDGAPSVHARYLYNSSGQRVKKLVQKQGAGYEATICIDAVFEHHRQTKAGDTAENNSLHVVDNQVRIAILRVGNAFQDDVAPEQFLKYQVGDHLGSSNIVISGDGAWISREEYLPYGETSFGSFARKRYRFTGKEGDEESGLHYYAARYYAPWLARWGSCDPAGMVDGLQLYGFTRNNPLRFSDSAGTQSNDVSVRSASDAGGWTVASTPPTSANAGGSRAVNLFYSRAPGAERKKEIDDRLASQGVRVATDDPDYWARYIKEFTGGRVNVGAFTSPHMIYIENGWEGFLPRTYASRNANALQFIVVDQTGYPQRRPNTDINDAFVLYGRKGEFLGAFQLTISNALAPTKKVVSSWNDEGFGVTYNSYYDYRALRVFDQYRSRPEHGGRVVVDIHKFWYTAGCIEVSPIDSSGRLIPVNERGERRDFAAALGKLGVPSKGPIGNVTLLGYGAGEKRDPFRPALGYER